MGLFRVGSFPFETQPSKGSQKGIDVGQTIEKVWLYSDAQVSMDVATGVALEISKGHGAHLTLLMAVEAPRDPFLRTPIGQEMMGLVREDRQQRLHALEQQAQRELPQGRVASVVLEGEVPWHTLTSHAIKHHPDLVIVPADGGESAGPFGTLSQHLFRKCPAPVWSVQSSARRHPKRALVAVDPGLGGSDERLLSQEVLRLAIGLAGHSGMELHLGHAWNLYNEELIASRFDRKTIQPLLDSQLQYAREATEQLLQQFGGKDRMATVHYRKGEPGKAIPTLADEIDADVVILGSAARRGLQGFFMGSVAETILSRLGRSALVVKRPGFISPVAGSPMPDSVRAIAL